MIADQGEGKGHRKPTKHAGWQAKDDHGQAPAQGKAAGARRQARCMAADAERREEAAKKSPAGSHREFGSHRRVCIFMHKDEQYVNYEKIRN